MKSLDKVDVKYVGYWIHEKKLQKFSIVELAEECRMKNIYLIKINLDEPLDRQGPFDLILHKLTAQYALALQNDLQMAIVFSLENLKDFQTPFIAQSFINHGAVLYKLFIVGPAWFVAIRHSLKNFEAGNKQTIYFNSNSVSKPEASSPLTKLDEEDISFNHPEPNYAIFERIVQSIRKSLNMELLGIDIVIDIITKKYAIIDINPFPGYESIPNFMKLLAEVLHYRIESRNCDDENNIPLCISKHIDSRATSNCILTLDQRISMTNGSSNAKEVEKR